MNDELPGATVLPAVIRQVSLALYATAVVLFAIAIGAPGAMLQGWFGRSLPIHILCALLLLVIAGIVGGLFHLLMGRSFAHLNKVAYEWVRATSWNPLVAVVTNAGQRLDSAEVRALFGVDREEGGNGAGGRRVENEKAGNS